jgi:hypothetical protein
MMFMIENVETLDEAVMIIHNLLHDFKKYGNQCVVILEKSGTGGFNIIFGKTFLRHTKQQLLERLPGVECK